MLYALYYYSILVVGATAVLLSLYSLILMRLRSYFPDSRRLFQSNKANLDSSFKYKRDDEDSECVVCLSVFEEGEELRQLPECKHTFHAPCIDAWLYSHMDCPLCRSAVEVPGLKRRPEHSREGLLVPVPLF